MDYFRVIPNSFIGLRKTKKKKTEECQWTECSNFWLRFGEKKYLLSLEKSGATILGCAASKLATMPTELSWLQTEQNTNINTIYKWNYISEVQFECQESSYVLKYCTP